VPAPANRLKTLPPYAFAVLTQRVRELNAQGMDVIGLDIGSPDMPPPEFVIEALEESANHPGHHSYAGYKGTPQFRAAIAKYYRERFGVTIDPETQVIPLIGSKEGIVNLSLAYLDTGDLSLTPDISYPSYQIGAHLAGADVGWLPVDEAGGYLPDLDAVPADLLASAKMLWVDYPNNPTGATADLDFYQKAVDFCNANDLLLASDNPYVDVTYDSYVAGSALQADNAMNCTVEFISFSKTYNMAGWRVGAAVGNAEGIKRLTQIKTNMDSGSFRPIYDAGVIAVEQTTREWIDARNAIYQRRRDMILDALPHVGLRAQKPKGSLYVWAHVEDGGDGGTYAEAALSNAHVSVAPGEIYGPGGRDYIRLSVGIADDRLEEALYRLKKWYSSK
jgi:LL-diaminopimelate aminotransferase